MILKFRSYPKRLRNFPKAKVTVFGLGVSGMAATELLVYLGAEVTVVDQGNPDQWKNASRVQELIGRKNCYSQDSTEIQSVFSASELIIISPGIPTDHPVLTQAHPKKIPLWSEIELGYQFSDAPIIAITGTNGKTTTVSLLEDMLKRAEISAFVGGNIGIPFCQYGLQRLQGKTPPASVIVLEISSFQLESIHQFRPHVAVITNLALNHEERYTSLESYARAKFQMVKNMSERDVLLYPHEIPFIKMWSEGMASYGQNISLIPFSKEMVLDELSSDFNLKSFSLTGWHNWENLFCAQKAFRQLLEIQDVESTFAIESIQKTIDQFPGVPHRLERVSPEKFGGQPRPYLIYNDAKSTNLAATATAVSSLMKIKGDQGDQGDREIYLIYGGKKRDDHTLFEGDWRAALKGVSKILLVGETTDDLYPEFVKKFMVSKCYTLERAVDEVDAEKFSGILLLSPGFPSFDQFENYAHRGECFKKIFSN